jgi:hypothetical protein
MISDKQKSERIPERGELLLLRSSIDFPLPELPDKKLVLASKEQIQEIADRDDRALFLIYEPLRVEGPDVFARIAIRDAVTRRRGVFTQYKYTFVFRCVKKNDQWVFADAIGYAQS